MTEFKKSGGPNSNSNMSGSGQIEDLRATLIEKCHKAGLKAEIGEIPDGPQYVAIDMPNGPDKRLVSFSSEDSIQKALRLNFEKYVFLGHYVAVADYEQGTIEAEIRPVGIWHPRLVRRRLFGIGDDTDELKPIVLTDDGGSDVTVEIGEMSDVLQLLGRGRMLASKGLSVKINGTGSARHDECLYLLRRVADSLFFQIDMLTGLALTLHRRFQNKYGFGTRGLTSPPALEFPRVEFDEGPMSLYRYARSAVGMPLLQFLAFYQVIEYYFPAYSKEDARRRIRAVLKDPLFRCGRDADIGRVLSIMSGRGRGFGDEKSQLRATLNACVDPVDLKRFLVEDDERSQFLSSKQKGLVDSSIPLASKETDFRGYAADLIYDIRCKIVHTKGENPDGEVQLVLPFSREAEMLYYDIQLIQYLATNVLIAASTPLTL